MSGSAPKPPPGFSPTLEWHVESRKSALGIALSCVLLFVVIELVLFGPSALGSWVTWVFSLGTGALLYYGFAGRTFSAGEDWLRHLGWVNTYRLQVIELNVLQGSVSLTLQDDLGGGLSIDIEKLRSHERMWDLVHQGMRRSVESGITVRLDEYARREFKLPSANPTAESKAKFEELKAARKGPKGRRVPGLVLHWVGWPLLALAAIAGAASHDADGIRGAVVIGVAALALIVAAFLLRRPKKSGQQGLEVGE